MNGLAGKREKRRVFSLRKQYGWAVWTELSDYLSSTSEASIAGAAAEFNIKYNGCNITIDISFS